ncbi:MAG: FAD-dependent oxidoreductase [Sphaerochaetaceae bacterium]|jgi:NADH dehydrogenase
MDKKRIVILGGGYAGVHAAKILHKSFKKYKDQVEVTLVDRHKYHTLMTELHEVAGNRVNEDSVKISFNRIFAGKNVNVIQDEVVNIDFKKQQLEGEAGTYPYDQLLIATGAEPADFNIPGIKEHSFYLWSLEDALRIKRHIIDTVTKASYEKDPEIRKEMLTFVVAGGGFTGVELVGELIEWLPILCKQHGIDPSEIRLMNVEALGSILNMLTDKPRAKAVQYMEKNGVEIKLNSLITNATDTSVTIKDGTVIRTRTLVWTCGVRGTTFTHNLPLTDGKVQRKAVDEFMRSFDYENVYLAGDGIWFMEDGKPVGQIVEAAEQTAATAAHSMAYNIKQELGLKAKEPQPFKSNFHGFMVSIGGRYAVSNTMGIVMYGFFAQAIKHMVNMYYQFGVCGVNGVWTYFKHEILNIKDKRSLIGGLAEYKVPSYWIVFLRIYLGVMWLIEGLGKVFDGWLTDTTGSKVYWGDAVGGASQAVADTAAEVVGGVSVGSASYVGEVVEAVGAASGAAGDAVQQFAPPLLKEPTALFNWINDTFVAMAPYFFQIMIVLAEVGIGLLFIAGLFTFPAAIVSLGLSVMFLIGALAGKEIIWFMAVSIVMLGGAGRAFGLDYWVMPYLKKLWNKTPIAKKTYLFMDEPEFTRKQMERRLEKQKEAIL